MVQHAVTWEQDLSAARERARDSRKLVLVDLYRTT